MSNTLSDLIVDHDSPVDTQESRLAETASPSQSSILNAHKEAEELLIWDAPNRIYDPKSTQWFLGLFAAGLVSIVILAVLREIWLILVVAAFVFVYYALARVEPSDIVHRVLSTGIEIGGRLYLWEDLKSFWIAKDENPAQLKIETKLILPHSLELLLPDDTDEDEMDELKRLLSQYLPVEAKPHSQAGEMVDSALLSITKFVPQRQRVQSWLERKILK